MYDQSRRRTTYDLVFAKYPGLTASVRKPSYRGLVLLSRAEEVLGVDFSGARLSSTARIEAIAPVIDAFAEALVRWDLVDDGVAVPATRAGIEAQDYEFVVDMVLTWYRRVVLRVEREEAETPKPDTSRFVSEANDLEDELAALPFQMQPVAAEHEPSVFEQVELPSMVDVELP